MRALRANPDVAISVDTESFPPEVLSIRGRAEIAEIEGVAPEYAEAAHRFLGPEQAAEYLSEIDQPGTRMARIAVRPRWVGLMDFQTRMPSALGGEGFGHVMLLNILKRIEPVSIGPGIMKEGTDGIPLRLARRRVPGPLRAVDGFGLLDLFSHE